MGFGGTERPFRRQAVSAVLAVLWIVAGARLGAAEVLKPGSRSPLVAGAIDHGHANPSERHHVVVGLALHDRDALESFLADVHDPASPRYHRFLTQAEFNELHAPTEGEEAAVAD